MGGGVRSLINFPLLCCFTISSLLYILDPHLMAFIFMVVPWWARLRKIRILISLIEEFQGTFCDQIFEAKETVFLEELEDPHLETCFPQGFQPAEILISKESPARSIHHPASRSWVFLGTKESPATSIHHQNRWRCTLIRLKSNWFSTLISFLWKLKTKALKDSSQLSSNLWISQLC